MSHIDTLTVFEELVAAGVPELQAKAQVHTLNTSLDGVATKEDLRLGLAMTKEDLKLGLAMTKEDLRLGLAMSKEDLKLGLATLEKDLRLGLATLEKDLKIFFVYLVGGTLLVAFLIPIVLKYIGVG